MKKKLLTFLPAILLTGMMISCGGGKQGSEEQSAEAVTEEPAEEAAPKYSGKTIVGVVHSVEDFDKWVAVYNEVADPEAHISYYENVDKPNEIVVFNFTTGHEAAREGFASQEMKETMARAGVNSEPVFTYYDMQYMNNEPTGATYRVAISHEVSDYNAWKPVFDADESRRAEAGLELRGLARDADNGNLVHMVFATNDLEPVKGMLGDPGLKAKMEEAGVVSEPVASFWKTIGQ